MSKLELRIVWEDEHMIEVSAFAQNNHYSGATKFYASREEFVKIANQLSGYPKRADESVSFEAGQGEEFSHLSCSLVPSYPTSHFKACVRIAWVSQTNLGEEKNNVYLEFPFEPNSVDSFVLSLRKMSSSPINAVAPVLHGVA